jgi:dihydrofolate reductase
MRKIILQVAISLDGYIEDANGAYDWCSDPELNTGQDYGMTDFLSRIDTLFMGRKTFDMMKDMPVNPDDPFVKSMAHIKQYVFTANENVSSADEYTVISKDTIEWIRDFKKTNGKDIWLFGGASFTTSLFEHALVDELILAVHPILLGDGKSFNQYQKGRIKLRLIDAEKYNTGLVMMKYNILS